MAPHRQGNAGGVGAAWLAGASRWGEPDGWRQREEERAVNSGRTKTAEVGEEMAGGDDEKRRTRRLGGGDGALVRERGGGCAHQVRRDEVVPVAEMKAAGEVPQQR